MSVETIIVDMVNDIESSDSIVTFPIIAWPYSRNLIKGVCKYLGLECKYRRIDKRFEEFSINAEEKVISDFKTMFKLINTAARDSGNNITKERNAIVKRICQVFQDEDDI